MIEQLAPGPMDPEQVLLETLLKLFPPSLVLRPEADGVTATELGFLNVVVFVTPLLVEVTIVKAVIAGAVCTVIVIGTVGTEPPADEVPVSVPL